MNDTRKPIHPTIPDKALSMAIQYFRGVVDVFAFMIRYRHVLFCWWKQIKSADHKYFYFYRLYGWPFESHHKLDHTFGVSSTYSLHLQSALRWFKVWIWISMAATLTVSKPHMWIWTLMEPPLDAWTHWNGPILQGTTTTSPSLH